MHWTNKLPTCEGWYWYRETPKSPAFPRCVWKEQYDGIWYMSFSGLYKVPLEFLFSKNSDSQISNEAIIEPVNNFEDKNEEVC